MCSRSVDSKKWQGGRPAGRVTCTKSGQIHVIDFVISMSAFMLLVVFAYSLWAGAAQRSADALDARLAADAANRALNSVLFSTGEPSHWAVNATSITSVRGIGCADSPYVLDRVKLGAATALYNASASYNATKEKMGIGSFDADIRIVYPDGTAAYTFGAPPNINSTVLSSAAREGLLDNRVVWVRARIWRPAVP